jgi:2-dehydro-3-deoxyphosphogluconate aldolase/(4S)-4-hydroxy-2-oxoglutarate aldolase
MSPLEILKIGKIIPVVVIDDANHSIPLAEALLEGGIKTIEITLRTKAAIPAIEKLAKAETGITIGAGTITSPQSAQMALDAGAEFLISPGITDKIAEFAANNTKTPLICGIATASEALLAIEYGLDVLKFFPASLSGGSKMLANFASLFPNISFCPTGGISLDNIKEYLALSNVVCVGGSWLAPRAAMNDGNWEEISKITQTAVSFCQSI